MVHNGEKGQNCPKTWFMDDPFPEIPITSSLIELSHVRTTSQTFCTKMTFFHLFSRYFRSKQYLEQSLGMSRYEFEIKLAFLQIQMFKNVRNHTTVFLYLNLSESQL